MFAKTSRKDVSHHHLDLIPLEIGSTVVRVLIPDVDCARRAPRNLLAVVIHVKNDLYKLCEYPHINYSNIYKK